MAEKTNLNVAPYYDDFESTDNFVKTLFRPGFAIQARELTQLQSALQNQISQHGGHIFAEGAMVIPGAVAYNRAYHSLKLASTFAGETVDPSQYFSTTTPVTITGATTGVTATVIGFDAATSTDQPTLYLRYINTGTDGATNIFADGENLSANSGITHTTVYSASAESATTFTSVYSRGAGSSVANMSGSAGPAAALGNVVTVEAGIFFIRGHFVETTEQILVLDKYSNNSSFRVGFTIAETLVTPEDDTTLLDNATGSTNFAAKGAHRLKYTLTLAKLARDSTADSTFVELLDTKSGVLQSIVRETEYDVLADTLARRTHDESGDYTVRPFQLQIKEAVDLNERDGVYAVDAITDDGNTAANTFVTAEVSMGKAYVKGYEIEKIAPTYKDIGKARDFETVNASQTLVSLGNFVLVNNLFGSPEISAISGESTAYKGIALYSDVNASRGSSNNLTGNNVIGQARVRAIEYSSGTVGQTDAQYKLYLWDIKMFTYLTLSGTPSPTLLVQRVGSRVEGASSGAVGYVVSDQASEIQIESIGTRVVLIKESGIFTSGEKLLVSDSSETGQIVRGLFPVQGASPALADLTVTSVSGAADVTFTFDQVRSFSQGTAAVDGKAFTADAILQAPQRRGREQNSLTLNGTDVGGANANARSGAGEAGDDNANSGATFLEDILLPRLTDADKNNALEKLPKSVIKTLLTTRNSGLTDTQFTLRRQFVGTTNSSGVVAFNAGSNETFVALADKDYLITILTAGDGSGVIGQPVSIVDTASGAGTVTLTITDNTILGDSAKVRLTATILKTSVTQKSKTTRLMKQLKVSTGATDAYGTRPDDRDISLGRSDAFELVGVFDSGDTSVDAVAPTLTVGTITGAFTRGEIITGATTGAKGRPITTSSPLQYVSTNEIAFSSSEAITGVSSGAAAIISATTDGDTVITRRFVLDTGQRDNFYDISRITRKKGSSSPNGKLLVVYDYLEHGAGDIFTVDSYTDVAGRMEYDDIPMFNGSKIDPDEPRPSGVYPLMDTYDYRPSVDDVAGASATLATVDEITGNSFNFASRTFGGTGGTTVDTPKPGSFIQSDFEFFLSKMAALVLSLGGKFRIITGNSSENPILPKIPDDIMLIATMFIPAYTFTPSSIRVVREKHQRYTMKDIGRLEDRLDTVEYYTALSLLERNAESFEVTDANGLNRFKSGFMVDNFKGHRIGDTVHRDYKCAMDFEEGELRPQHRSKAVPLIEAATNTAERTASGYQKTGDMITLPYTEETLTSQLFASRQISAQTGQTVAWLGDITLSPSSDTWFETEVAPILVVNRNGDYDAVVAKERNNLGTIWNSWQTSWSGVVSTRGETQSRVTSKDEATVTSTGTRSINTVRTDKSRTGVTTSISLRVDRESQGLRTVSKAAIPFMRSKTITFTGENFKPKTRVYVFFNKTDVNAFVTPSSSDFSSDSSPILNSPLITTSTGKISGTFTIPDAKVGGNPRFPTGEVLLTITSSSTNGRIIDDSGIGTFGAETYSSSGLLETQQETIIATRRAIVNRTSKNQSTSSNSENVGKWNWVDKVEQNRRRNWPETPSISISDGGGSEAVDVSSFEYYDRSQNDGDPGDPGAGFGGYGDFDPGDIGSALCWVARKVYGEDNEKWIIYREWMTTQAPKWFLNLYIKYGERFAEWIDDKPFVQKIIRKWMDKRIDNYQSTYLRKNINGWI